MLKSKKNKKIEKKVAFFLEIKKICIPLQSQTETITPEWEAKKFLKLCGNSSVGRAQPCQGWGREFEPRFPL